MTQETRAPSQAGRGLGNRKTPFCPPRLPFSTDSTNFPTCSGCVLRESRPKRGLAPDVLNHNLALYLNRRLSQGRDHLTATMAPCCPVAAMDAEDRKIEPAGEIGSRNKRSNVVWLRPGRRLSAKRRSEFRCRPVVLERKMAQGTRSAAAIGEQFATSSMSTSKIKNCSGYLLSSFVI